MIQKTLTVRFSDLDGFIKLIESVGEEKSIKLLFIKFKEIEKIIDSKNGEIRKIIGDSVLFSFANIQDAVSAGKNIATISICKKGEIFYFHTGLATGTIYEIEMGNGNNDIYGKSVNTAALLVKEAKLNKDRIAICPYTIFGLNSQL